MRHHNMSQHMERGSGFRQWKKLLWSLLGILFAVLCLGGCEQAKQTDTLSDQKEIAVICKGEQHQFWQTVKAGAEEAGEELGVAVTFEAPTDESQIDAQIEMVEKAIEKKVDAILLAPLDTDKLNHVIDKASAEGIPVLTFDSDVTTDTRVATIGTDNITGGAIAARNAVEQIGTEGKVAVIVHVKGAQTAIEREKGFVDEISKHKGIEIVGTEFCNGDPELAKEQASEFIRNHPDLKCIYATNEGSALGAAQAVQDSGITLIGFDSSDDEIRYLEDGWIQGMMVQNPYNMGYLGIRNIYKAMQGKKLEEKIDTGITYVDRNNVQDEDIQWLLYPMGKEK